MAWISLVVVVVIFFFPGIGLAPQHIGQELTATIEFFGVSVAFPIPGTGPIRLLLECIGVWLVFWLLLYLSDRLLGEKALFEKKPYKDFLTRLGRWNDFINASQPSFSNQFADKLAKLYMVVFLGKFVLGYVLQLILDAALPSLVGFITRWVGSEFLSGMQSFLGEMSQTLVKSGLNEGGLILLILSALIVIANWAMQSEQQYRYEYAVQQQQEKFRKQRKIDLSISQS
jgi:hypothetical protein